MKSLVCLGHDDWVYGVCWWPRNSCHGTDQSDRSSADHLQLLSCSMDKTIILWQPDPSSGVWLEEVYKIFTPTLVNILWAVKNLLAWVKYFTHPVIFLNGSEHLLVWVKI